MSKVMKTAQLCALDKKAILDFLTATAATENFSGGSRQIYCMDPNGKPRLISWFRQKPDAIEKAVNSLEFHPDATYYTTKCGCFADKRGTERLFSLDAVVVDIDCHNRALSESEYKYECERLLYEIDMDATGRIPPISAITKSGRGLHLWILLESVSAKLLWLYHLYAAAIGTEIQRICTDIESPFEVDMQSTTNASGLIRIGGTVNQSAERLAVFEMHSGRRYSFDDLQEFVAQNFDAKNGKRYNRKCGDRTIDENERRIKYRPLNIKRMRFLECLVKSKPHQTGRRALLLFAFINAAFCAFSDADRTENAAICFNKLFDEPLPASELQKALKSVIKQSGYDYITVKGFFNLISANDAERYLYENLTSRRDEIRTEKRNAKEERNKHIISLFQKGLTQSEISKETSCGQATISRIIREYKKHI